MKKEYIKPSMKVIEMKVETVTKVSQVNMYSLSDI